MPFTYATWNPLDKNADLALSGGDLIATKSGGSWVAVRATMSKSGGKHYFELSGSYAAGYRCGGVGLSSQLLDESLGTGVYGWGHRDDGYKLHSGATAYDYSWPSPYVIGVAVDLDVGKVWISKNGTWAGDPVAGTGEMFAGLSGSLFPMISMSGGSVTANFGASAFSYSVPSGFNSGWYLPADEDAPSLLHFDGDDASTLFTDESGKVWTAAGAAQLDTAQQKFGTASGLFNNSTSTYISTPYHTDFAIGNSDWTVDFRVRFNAVGAALVEIGVYSEQIAIYQNSGYLNVALRFGTLRQFAWTPSTGIWYHVAVVFVNSSNELYAFIDGAQIGTMLPSNIHPTIASGVIVGNYSMGNLPLNGWIDELRISNVARWTSNFTPKPSAYGPIEVSISEDASSDDAFAADLFVGRDISEDASVNTSFNDNIGDFDESATANDEFDVPNIDGIDEAATSDDAISVTGTYNAEMYEEFLTHAEILGTVYYEITLADGFATTDSQIPGLIYYKTNDDTFLLVDESTGSIVKIGSISDGFMIYDTPRPDWQKTILDTFDAADLSTKILGFVNPDSLTATDTPVSMWHGVEQLSETPFIYDSNVYAQYLKSIADTFAATDTVNLLLTLSISDWLTLRDSLNSKEFISLSETFDLADSPTRWWDKSIAESLVSTDSLTELGSFGLAISDAFTIADAITRNYLIRDTIADTFALADSQDIHSHLYSTLADSLDLSILITLTGDTYECWVLNTPKFHPSVYSGFNFNSYATFNGRAYGANSTGIYELTGTTDSGTAIKTGVVLPKSLLGIPTAKRLLKAKLGVTGTTPVLILEVENGTRKTFPISTFKIADGNRDVKGREWTVSVTDFDTLDSLSLTPQVLPR
jgi:hypothetical protein